MKDAGERPEGLRNRRRRETRQRIADEGLRLFIAHGYDGTTIEAIAEAAGISRRTFFYYFASKEDVLMAWQGGGFLLALKPAMLQESPHQPPLKAARRCLLKLVSRFETKESVTVAHLLRSTEALQTRKKAVYVEMEQALLAGMIELWPAPGERARLRTAAMIALGALRLANDEWMEGGGVRPLAGYLKKTFDTVEAHLSV